MINRSKILALLTLIMFIGLIAPATPMVQAKDKKQDIVIIINGSQLQSDVAPQIVDERTMVPMRAIFEALGASVEWDPETQSITGTKGTTVIYLQVDNLTATVDGEPVQLDVPIMIVNGRTMVPARFVSETMGMNVDWNGDGNCVEIYDNEHNYDNSNHPNGNDFHDNNGLHNGQYVHNNQNHNNGNHDEDNNDEDEDNENDTPGIVTPSTIEITNFYSAGTPENSNVSLQLEGKVSNAPTQYTLLVQIGIPGHGSVMQMEEYGYTTGDINADGTFTMSYPLEPGQDLLAASIVSANDVKTVVIRPDTDPKLRLLAIAKSDYTTPGNVQMIAYNIIAKNGAPYLITTQHGLDSNGIARLGADMDNMTDGNIVSNMALNSEYAMDKIDFYKDGVLYKTCSATQINALTNKLPSGR